MLDCLHVHKALATTLNGHHSTFHSSWSPWQLNLPSASITVGRGLERTDESLSLGFHPPWCQCQPYKINRIRKARSTNILTIHRYLTHLLSWKTWLSIWRKSELKSMTASPSRYKETILKHFIMVFNQQWRRVLLLTLQVSMMPHWALSSFLDQMKTWRKRHTPVNSLNQTTDSLTNLQRKFSEMATSKIFQQSKA
jgi:hypothetical protein